MRLTILNLVGETLTCYAGTRTHPGAGRHVILPALGTTASLPKGCSELTLVPSAPNNSPKSKSEAWTIKPEGIVVRFTMVLSTSWHIIPVQNNCPWRIYRCKVSRKCHKLLIFPRRNLDAFLSEMPDTVPLSSLLLPGTHDTMAFYGWPISQCQSLSTPLAFQLQSGIRLLDIRLAVIDSRLIAYHGIYPQRTPFREILSTIHSFLASPSTSRETIVMSVKQEDFTVTAAETFSQLVHEEIFSGPGGREMWFFENRIPILNEVRGKVVMLSRFGGNGDGWEGGLEGLGIHPTTWPDSERLGFTWECKDTLVRMHDWYSIPSFLSIPEKVSLSTRILLPPSNSPPMPTLSITYFSASSFPLAFPTTIARGFGWPNWGLGVEGVNSRVGRWLLDILGDDDFATDRTEKKDVRGPRIRGWAFMDFFTDPENGILPLLVECNFRGRRPGEEGW